MKDEGKQRANYGPGSGELANKSHLGGMIKKPIIALVWRDGKSAVETLPEISQHYMKNLYDIQTFWW